MKCLLIDDEAPARSRLSRMLAAHPEVQVVGEAQDGLQALEKIEQLQPDLVFLDIQMPGIDGFQVLRSIPAEVPYPLVVFVTGYDQHALEAFEANALAYLLKPVDPERLATIVERASKLCAPEQQQAHAALTRSTPLSQVVGRKRDRFVLLNPSDILYFATEGGLLKAKTAAESYLVNYQLGELENGLAGCFFRARRSVLVNLTRVKEIRPYFKSSFLLVLGDSAETQIAVAGRQAKLLRQRIPGL